MLSCSDSFKSKMKVLGKQICVLAKYDNMLFTIDFEKNDIDSLEQNINGELFTSVCRSLIIEIEKVEDVIFEPKTEIGIKLGVKIDEEEEYEYVDWGSFVIQEVNDCVDTKSYKLTLYDYLIDTHVKYQDEPLMLDYSSNNITVKDLLKAICNKFGFTLKTEMFANSDKVIYENKYLNLDVTYRDILDEIAGCAGGFIKIFNKDLYVAYPVETEEIIDENDLKKLDIGKKIGPFNTLVLARSPQEDNIFYPANMENSENRVAIRIENNQIMDKNRKDFIVNLYNKVNGLGYYVFECEHYGFGYYEFGDIVTLKDLEGNFYKTILLNIVDNVNTGITGKEFAEETEFAETKYEYATSIEKRLKNTEIICDKQNGEIQLLVEEVDEGSEKMSQTLQTIDGIKQEVKKKVGSHEIISKINQSAEAIFIQANKINLNGVVTANNYFKINLDGSAHSTNMTIEGNFAEGHGLRIKGNPAFIDFYANSNDITTRLIDYGEQFLFAGNKNFSFVNVSNSGYVGIMAESLHLNGTQCRVWTGGHELLLSCTANVSVVNPNNSEYMPIIASDFVTGSSRRYKENIVDMTEDEALKILDVLVKVFDYRADSKMRGKGVAGVIAEEIVEVIPSCVSCKEMDGEMVPDGVDYSKLVPYLIKGLQMLYEKVNRIGG